MSIDLYYQPFSAPCRAVMLTAEALGLTLNYKSLDILNGEQFTPDYEQMNPLKSIPFIVDDDYKLGESRAIMGYLVDQYGEESGLYPTGASERAVVQQRLQFDVGTLYKWVAAYYYPVVFRGETEYNEGNYEKLKEAFQILDKLLEGNDWAAGSDMTIADLSLLSTVTTAEAFGFDLEEYSNVAEWLERVKSTAPGYDTANAEGVEILKNIIAGTSAE
ncbi:glutathione S-transferase 1-1 [Fopius arisanus]|uniref:GST1_1 protein n=1 Tax=Fopius arisanus TaxID=64838 RepID=A0A0C9RIY9_9HYME|nr:PREDICTED: glutathione S-transferase 1-1-like [Fopius arisanus]